ncbi:MAG: S8 family serine peptidase [Actinobacteria bacterium]|nr:S8 family serine peptidase [Actinomycetota bacterium]
MSLRRFLVCAAVLVLTAGAFTGMTPAQAAVNDPGYQYQWGMKIIGAEQAWATGTGAGTTIAVVDSGMFFGHEDYASGKILPGRNFIEDGQRPDDDVGHGTHVAGIAGASTNNGRGVVGVAPDAKILPVRVLELDEDDPAHTVFGIRQGVGTAQDVNAGIRWAVDNGAHVVNLSLGNNVQGVVGSSFVDAVRYAWDRGVICVIAAGNSFATGSGFSDEPALVVSATNRRDGKPLYSSGVGQAKWGMSAPGGAGTEADVDDILSTYWEPDDNPNTYAYAAGTSMAAPHVAGAAAILRGLGLTPQQTVDRLLATAKDIGSAGRDSTFGWGRLDLAKAVEGLAPAAKAGGSTGTTGATGSGTGNTRSSGGTRSTSTAPRGAGGASTAPAAPDSAASADGGDTGTDMLIVSGAGSADGATPDGKTNADDRVSARRELPGRPGGDDSLPWAAPLAAVVLLGAATRGIVRARRI